MLIIIGPSASGKTECAKILEKIYNLKKVITHTTRLPRINEINNIDYHFVNKDTFLEMKKNNEFVETMVYNNNYYGTSKKEISDNKCAILDYNGANVFYSLNNKRIFIVFLICDKNICKQRMINRGDNKILIENRLKSDEILFNKDKQKIANIVINSSNMTSQELATKIYNLYINYLKTI